MALLTIPMVVLDEAQDDDAGQYAYPIIYIDGGEDTGGTDVDYYWG